MNNKLRGILKNIYLFIIKNVKFFRPLYDTRNTTHYITKNTFFIQKILRINSNIPWPVHYSVYIGGLQNIKIGVGASCGDNRNVYVQAIDKVYIGDYTRIAAYTKIISSNHSTYNHNEHVNGGIRIGKYCWLGIGCIILPKVVLGDHTIVGAGAVVTKSFPEGYCIIAGNPAKVVKYLDKSKIVEYKHPVEYVGYKRKDELTEKDTYYNDEQ